MGIVTDRVKDRRDDTAQVTSPFDGWPATRFIKDASGDLAGIVIEPVVLTPLRAKLAKFLAFVSTFAAMAAGLGTAYATGAAWYWWYLSFGVPVIFAAILHEVYRVVLSEHCRLIFTPTRLTVQRGLGRIARYDREQPHRFRLDARHWKAREEAERHERIKMRAQMNRRVARPEKYHTDCLHLMLDYRGQPRTLMEIMGQEEALLVLARVKLVDEVMDRITAMADIAAKGAQAEWDDMPGKIPEKV